MNNKSYCREIMRGSLILLSIVAMPLHAADAKLKEDPFWESVQPDVDVSGVVVVGVTTGSLLSGSDLSDMYLRPPAELAGKDICLTVQSRDGVYLSRNTYVLPAAPDVDPVNLPYDQSTKLDLLEKYPNRKLGISVATGDCDDLGQQFLRPYGAGDASRSSVDLMVNGFGATDVFYSIPELELTGHCEALRDGRTTVFDFWCHIPELAASENQAIEIRIERERYGRELAPATLVLAADST